MKGFHDLACLGIRRVVEKRQRLKAENRRFIRTDLIKAVLREYAEAIVCFRQAKELAAHRVTCNETMEVNGTKISFGAKEQAAEIRIWLREAKLRELHGDMLLGPTVLRSLNWRIAHLASAERDQDLFQDCSVQEQQVLSAKRSVADRLRSVFMTIARVAAMFLW